MSETIRDYFVLYLKKKRKIESRQQKVIAIYDMQDFLKCSFPLNSLFVIPHQNNIILLFF